MRCPHCKMILESLSYNASFSERIYGSSYGNYDISSEEYNNDDQETSSYEEFEEDDYETYCPECDANVEPDELIEDDEVDEEEPKAKQSENLKKVLSLI